MDMTPFTTAPGSARHDGWSPARKLRFLERLAMNGNVRAACAAVGMSRETAYALRRRDALFARGWASALLLARESSAELLADKATEGIEEEVWYRGELKGTRRRFDARLLLAHMARLDKLVEEADHAAARDAGRFEEILACIAEVEVPEEIKVEEEPLPLDRAGALDMAGEEAAQAVDEAWNKRTKNGKLNTEDYARYRAERTEAGTAARAAAAERWDAWFASACERIDAVKVAAESAAWTVSELSGSAGSRAVGPDGRCYAYA